MDAPTPISDSGFSDDEDTPTRPIIFRDVPPPSVLPKEEPKPSATIDDSSPTWPGWDKYNEQLLKCGSPTSPADNLPDSSKMPDSSHVASSVSSDPADSLKVDHPLNGVNLDVDGQISPRSPPDVSIVDAGVLAEALQKVIDCSGPDGLRHKSLPSSPVSPTVIKNSANSAPANLKSTVDEFESSSPTQVVCSPKNVEHEIDEFSSQTLMDDPSAYGPTILGRDILSMPTHEGTWTTRARLPTAPAPPLILQRCLLTAVGTGLKVSEDLLWAKLCELLPNSLLVHPRIVSHGLTTDHLQLLCAAFEFRAVVDSQFGSFLVGRSRCPRTVYLIHRPGHWSNSTTRLKLPPQINSPVGCSLSKYLAQHPQIPTRRVFSYRSSTLRAKNLMSNIKHGLDGISSKVFQPGQHKDILHLRDELVTMQPPRNVELAMVLGFAGCGKSRPIMETIKAVGDYLIVVPTCQLRQEWLNGLNLRSEKWRVSTWEVAVQKPIRFIVIDEIFKLPNGYLDLILALNPTVTSVLLLGDPLQGDYHSTNPDSTNNRITQEVDYLKPFYSSYCAYTHRLDRTVARCLGVWTSSTEEGRVSFGSTVLKDATSLVPSKHAASLMCENSMDALTAASSQGLTFPRRVNIVLDKSWVRCSPQISLVACTRSRVGIHFVKDGLCSKHYGTHPAFDAIFNNEPVDYVERFRSFLGQAQILRKPEDISLLGQVQKGHPFLSGKGAIHAHQRLHGPRIKDSYTQDVVASAPPVSELPQIIPSLDTTHLPETRRPMHFDINCAAPEPLENSTVFYSQPSYEPVYPGFNYEFLLPELQREEAPEDLEIVYKGVMSRQFPHLNIPFESAASSLSLLAPDHQSRRDPTLLGASINKRLRFRPSESPVVASTSDFLASQLLYHSYCDALHLDPSARVPFDPMLFVDCICENEYAQLSSKTRSVIMANANRSDPDWRHTVVRIFSKTQHKVNESSLFSGWKACQTLALMHDAIILTFGPVKKYQRAILARQKTNPKIFVYAGRSPNDLSEFCQLNFPPNSYRCWNDFTSFDQSQGCETTLFETLKMKRVSIPIPIVDLHLQVKTSLSCQFGNLTSMRFTGEPGTYDDNTDYNMAIANLKYDITSVGGLFSGDDSAFPVLPPARPSWDATSKLFGNLRFKTETGRYATFCGYYVGSQGAVRAPRPLLVKLVNALDDDTLRDKIASYVAEFSVGHSLGDVLWDLLPLELVPYQSAVFDFICRHAPREMKTSLNIGEIPLDILSSLGLRLTRPIFALLNRSQRMAYLKIHPSRFSSWSSSFLPSVEGQLLE